MSRHRRSYFPHDSGYDMGDAQHLPVVPEDDQAHPHEITERHLSHEAHPSHPKKKEKNHDQTTH